MNVPPTQSPPRKSLHRAAQIALVLLLLSVAAHLLVIWRIWYQLESPIIPLSMLIMMAKPPFFIALGAAVASLAALVLYFFKRYVWILVLVGAVLLWQQYYPYTEEGTKNEAPPAHSK